MKLLPELEQVQHRWRVLRDRVLVKRLTYENKAGLYVAGVKLEKGVIVAVGNGRRTKRLIAMKQNDMSAGRETLFEDGPETGAVRPVSVRVGQVVEFSPRNYTEIDFDKCGCHGAGVLVVLWEQGIMLVDPAESKSDAMLFQQSAGYDRNGHFLSGAEHW